MSEAKNYLPKITIASGNKHKIQEIAEIFAGVAEVSGAQAMPEVEETETSFEGNARLKAEAIPVSPDSWVLADDSGLEVDALAGNPGVWSARYAGEGASDEQNRRKLLAELERVGAQSPEQRQARFRCVLVLRGFGSQEQVFQGSCEGRIAAQERGEGGFGYDPLFVPEGFEQSFAELPSEKKNELSHRGQALAALREWLLNS